MTKYETVKKLNLIYILEEKNVTPKCCYPDKQRLLQARRKSSWRTSVAAWQARLQFCVSGMKSCFLQVGLASKHQVLVGEFQSHKPGPCFVMGSVLAVCCTECMKPTQQSLHGQVSNIWRCGTLASG